MQKKVKTLESHQETLRATITAQESLIKEEQLKCQVHNNLALMFLDEIIDDGESLTTEECSNKAAGIQEIHSINNDLQKQLEEVKKDKERVTEKLSDLEEDNKHYCSRINSLEETHNELEDSSATMRRTVISQDATIQSLARQLERKKTEE